MVAIAFFLLLIATSVVAEDVITTFSGSKVPLHLIQKHYERKLVPHDLMKTVIYELSDNKVLQGHGFHLDLRTAKPAKFDSSPNSFNVILNGKLKGETSAKVKTFHTNDYVIIIEEHSGRVLSVTGKGIALTPLHRTHFPRLFVNKIAFSKHQVDLSDDVEYPPDILNEPVDLSDDVAYPPDVLNEPWDDGTENVGNASSRQSGGSCASGTTHYVKIAAAYDNTFCALYDNKESAATAALQSVFEKANVAYAENTCIQLALTHVEAHCQDSSDPYASLKGSPASVILDRFQEIWRSSRDNVARDAAYFFSGFEDGTSVAGRASVAAACSNDYGYGWVEGPSEKIFAHEAGHTLSAGHSSSGIMMGVLSSSTAFHFSDESVRQFIDYIDNNSRSSCIGTKRPSSLPKKGKPSSTRSPRPKASPKSSPTKTPAPSKLPGETPSPSPRARKTVNPVDPARPKPSPRVNPSEEVCKSGFTNSRALICHQQKLAHTTIRSSLGTLGEVQVFLEQRNGQFQMKYVVTDMLILTEYRDLVTTDKAEAEGDGGPFKTVDGEVQSVETRWEANSMPKVDGKESCCGENLYMRVTLMVCTKGSMRMCGRISGRFDTAITCGDTCNGKRNGVLVPMSERQACPSCEGKK